LGRKKSDQTLNSIPRGRKGGGVSKEPLFGLKKKKKQKGVQNKTPNSSQKREKEGQARSAKMGVKCVEVRQQNSQEIPQHRTEGGEGGEEGTEKMTGLFVQGKKRIREKKKTNGRRR